MYRKYVDQLDPQSGSEQQRVQQQSHSNMSDEDQWRSQWESKPVEELWKALQASKDNHSLLKKHLTEDRYKALKDKKTTIGGTLAQCMSSGTYTYTDTFMYVCMYIVVFVS